MRPQKTVTKVGRKHRFNGRRRILAVWAALFNSENNSEKSGIRSKVFFGLIWKQRGRYAVALFFWCARYICAF